MRVTPVTAAARAVRAAPPAPPVQQTWGLGNLVSPAQEAEAATPASRGRRAQAVSPARTAKTSGGDGSGMNSATRSPLRSCGPLPTWPSQTSVRPATTTRADIARTCRSQASPRITAACSKSARAAIAACAHSLSSAGFERRGGEIAQRPASSSASPADALACLSTVPVASCQPHSASVMSRPWPPHAVLPAGEAPLGVGPGRPLRSVWVLFHPISARGSRYPHSVSGVGYGRNGWNAMWAENP
jgi:hypothetical protein